MVLNATFNNISVLSWRSVLLVEETGVPGENHRSVASQDENNFNTCVRIAVGVCPFFFYLHNALNKKGQFCKLILILFSTTVLFLLDV